MKYTIHGFQQAKLIEYGLNHTEALILRVYVDCFRADGFTRKYIDAERSDDGEAKLLSCIPPQGEMYVWVTKKLIKDEIPILNIVDRTIARYNKRLVEKGVIKTVAVKNRYFYVRPIPEIMEYLEEIPGTGEEIQKDSGKIPYVYTKADKNVRPGMTKMSDLVRQKCQPKDPLIISFTKDPCTSIVKIQENSDREESPESANGGSHTTMASRALNTKSAEKQKGNCRIGNDEKAEPRVFRQLRTLHRLGDDRLKVAINGDEYLYRLDDKGEWRPFATIIDVLCCDRYSQDLKDELQNVGKYEH